jgi:hypothetical protein
MACRLARGGKACSIVAAFTTSGKPRPRHRPRSPLQDNPEPVGVWVDLGRMQPRQATRRGSAITISDLRSPLRSSATSSTGSFRLRGPKVIGSPSGAKRDRGRMFLLRRFGERVERQSRQPAAESLVQWPPGQGCRRRPTADGRGAAQPQHARLPVSARQTASSMFPHPQARSIREATSVYRALQSPIERSRETAERLGAREVRAEVGPSGADQRRPVDGKVLEPHGVDCECSAPTPAACGGGAANRLEEPRRMPARLRTLSERRVPARPLFGMHKRRRPSTRARP